MLYPDDVFVFFYCCVFFFAHIPDPRPGRRPGCAQASGSHLRLFPGAARKRRSSDILLQAQRPRKYYIPEYENEPSLFISQKRFLKSLFAITIFRSSKTVHDDAAMRYFSDLAVFMAKYFLAGVLYSADERSIARTVPTANCPILAGMDASATTQLEYMKLSTT